jgi:hypothetical protein
VIRSCKVVVWWARWSEAVKLLFGEPGLTTWSTKQQLYSFWSPGSPNSNFTSSDHLAHQTTTLQLLITCLTKQQLYSFWSPASPNNNFTTSDHLAHQTTLQLLTTWLTKQQLYSFWSPGSPNNNFTASDHLPHQTTTLQLLPKSANRKYQELLILPEKMSSPKVLMGFILLDL